MILLWEGKRGVMERLEGGWIRVMSGLCLGCAWVVLRMSLGYA